MMANEAKGAMAADPQAITLLVQQPNNNRPQVLPPGILITTRRKAPTAGQSSAAKRARARARAAREQSRARGTGRRGLITVFDVSRKLWKYFESSKAVITVSRSQVC